MLYIYIYYVQTYIYIFTYIYTYTHICIYIHIYTYVYIHIHTYKTYTYKHIQIYIYICLHLIYTYVCTYIYTRIYIYMCVNTYIYMSVYIYILYTYIYIYMYLHQHMHMLHYITLTLHYIPLHYITVHYITYPVKPASWHQVQENMYERCNLSQLDALFAERKTHIPWAQNWGHKFGSWATSFNMVAPFLGPESGTCFGATKHKQGLFNTHSRRAPADASWQQHISVILRGYMPAKLALLLNTAYLRLRFWDLGPT